MAAEINHKHVIAVSRNKSVFIKKKLTEMEAKKKRNTSHSKSTNRSVVSVKAVMI